MHRRERLHGVQLQTVDDQTCANWQPSTRNTLHKCSLLAMSSCMPWGHHRFAESSMCYPIVPLHTLVSVTGSVGTSIASTLWTLLLWTFRAISVCVCAPQIKCRTKANHERQVHSKAH